MPTWVKFCGCTSWADVAMAIDAGADAFGMIFAPSPRRIAWNNAAEIAAHVPASIEPVAVFVDPSDDEVAAVRELFPGVRTQFSGNEPASFVAPFGERAIKAIHVGERDDPAAIAGSCDAYERGLILFDTRHDGLAGGTATTFPWRSVAGVAARRRVVVAGGLSAGNVAQCVREVRPYGVDVRSGVETGGRKDPGKMRAFVRAVRGADEA